MNAKEAAQVAETARKKKSKLKVLLNMIEMAARSGQRQVELPVNIFPEDLNSLRDLGYTISETEKYGLVDTVLTVNW